MPGRSHRQRVFYQHIVEIVRGNDGQLDPHPFPDRNRGQRFAGRLFRIAGGGGVLAGDDDPTAQRLDLFHRQVTLQVGGIVEPAGAEAVDPNLLTSSTADQAEGWSVADQQYQWGWWGWWWFNQTQVRDDKVVLFADYLPAGTYEYSYIMQASLPGEYRVIPATAREFYFPEVFGRTDGMLFEIEP